MPRTQLPTASKTVRDFVRRVEAKMKAADIGVADLAARTGLSRQYIYRILNGEHVATLTVAEKIASKLGLQITTQDVA
jgi:transcriptional regulator with XRE-family HTH domain